MFSSQIEETFDHFNQSGNQEFGVSVIEFSLVISELISLLLFESAKVGFDSFEIFPLLAHHFNQSGIHSDDDWLFRLLLLFSGLNWAKRSSLFCLIGSFISVFIGSCFNETVSIFHKTSVFCSTIFTSLGFSLIGVFFLF